MQHAQRVLKPLAITQLIAHAEQRHHMAVQVQGIDIVPMGFPVFLQFTKIPGRNAKNKNGIILRTRQGHIPDIMQINQLGTELFTNLLGCDLGIAGGRAVKQTDIHGAPFTLVGMVS